MPIIKDQKLVENEYVEVASEGTVPAAGSIIVGLQNFMKHKDLFLNREGNIGVRLDSSDDVSELTSDLGKLALLVLPFPKFADGRAYTQARKLRRSGFKGELRATGEVLRDQLFYMTRVGFNAFELQEGRDPENALEAFKDFSVTYQSSADDNRAIYNR